VERWEEPLHLGSFRAKYPTFSHNATPIAHFSPLFFSYALQAPKNPCISRVSRSCAETPGERGKLQTRLHDRHVGGRLQGAGRGHTIFGMRLAVRTALPPSPPRPAHVPRTAGAPAPATRSTRGVCAAALLTVALLAAALGGCGSSSPTGTSASPATVTPASAPLYLDAVVRPAGSLKTDATSAARTLTGRQRPFEGLLKLLAGPTGKAPSYAKEVEPWLGTHAGVFLGAVNPSSVEGLVGGELLKKALAEGFAGVEAALLGQGGLQTLLSSGALGGALVLDTTDVAKARSFLEAQAHSAGAHTTSYRGISYQVASDGVAEGIVHRFAVIGSEAGLKSVIDTASGNPALAQAAGYAKLVSTAERPALANLYFSSEELAPASGASGSGESTLPLVESLLGGPGQLYLSVIPSANAVALDIDTLPPTHPSSTASSSTRTSTSGAQVLSELPGSAWLAIGFGDLGRTLGSAHGLHALASLLSKVNIGSISLGTVFAPLSSHALNVQRELLSWMGATGAYVSGSSVLNLQAAVVITSKSPARSRAAVTKLAQAYREAGGVTAPTSVPGTETAVTVKLPNFPLTLTMAYGQGKFVVGVGTPSIQEALSPQSTLAGTPNYDIAAGALGQGLKPSALVEVHTLSGLLESLGLNQTPGFSGFASAVAPLSAIAVGGGESLPGGVTRARVVLALQAATQPAESG
jgi:hypothetical protein